MLRACNRVLKHGAPLAFFVVAVADDSPDSDTAQAIEVGPEYVNATPGYPALMESAGFVGVEILDVTDEYEVTLSESIRIRNTERPQLEELIGVEVFADGQASRHQELTAVQAGLLQRYLVTGLRPS